MKLSSIERDEVNVFLQHLNLQDKTFGLKNKKGAKTQKFIAQVEKQVKLGGQHPLANKPDEKKLEKERKLKVLIN